MHVGSQTGPLMGKRTCELFFLELRRFPYLAWVFLKCTSQRQLLGVLPVSVHSPEDSNHSFISTSPNPYCVPGSMPQLQRSPVLRLIHLNVITLAAAVTTPQIARHISFPLGSVGRGITLQAWSEIPIQMESEG